MTVNNTCETCGQTLPPTLSLRDGVEGGSAPLEPAHEPAQEPAQEPEPAQHESLDGFAAEYTELVKQLPLSARIKLATRIEKAGIARDAVGDAVLLPLQAAVAAQVRRRTVAKASSAAKRLAVKARASSA